VWEGVKILADRFLFWAGRHFGVCLIRLVASCIATGYFVVVPRRVRTSVEFYRAVFPGRSRLFYRYCAWRQFHGLAQSHCDDIAFSFRAPVEATGEGREHIRSGMLAGQGGIILVSHVGNWGVAARLFQRDGFKAMMIMGEREAKLVASKYREDLAKEGLTILISRPEDRDSLYTGIEALKFIREGGFLCIAGDIAWSDPRSRLAVTLFGRTVHFPTGPHLLALVSGAPVFTLFNFRVARGRYRLVILPPRHVKAASRDTRNRAVEESVHIYARQLEEAVRSSPFEWHVFDPVFAPDRPGAAA
jgi:predicted LPLAT superfamily acyltransferase